MIKTVNDTGVTSKVTRIDDIIYKTVDYGNLTEELITREIYWLRKLQPFGVSPKFIKRTFNNILMSYCGEPVTSAEFKTNDIQKQFILIMKVLNQNYCFYNDFKLDNLLILDGKLSIIDFGWCSLIKEDYTCNNTIISGLKEKPSGNWYTLFNHI